MYVGASIDWEDDHQVKFLNKFSAIVPNPFDIDIANPFSDDSSMLHVTDAGLGDFGIAPLLSMLVPERDVKVRCLSPGSMMLNSAQA